LIVKTLLFFYGDNFGVTRKLPAIEHHFLSEIGQLIEMTPEQSAVYVIYESILPVNYQ
jgi:hypothetical protein